MRVSYKKPEIDLTKPEDKFESKILSRLESIEKRLAQVEREYSVLIAVEHLTTPFLTKYRFLAEDNTKRIVKLEERIAGYWRILSMFVKGK